MLAFNISRFGRASFMTLTFLLSLVLLVGATNQTTRANGSQPPPTVLFPPDPAPSDDELLIPPSVNADPEEGDGLPPDSEGLVSLAVTGGTWLSQGPGPAYNGQVENMTNLEVAGAIHTVAAHPSNADILYAGATNGGLWRTTNATAASPNWTPLTDGNSSLSIGALEFDPTDLTSNTLLAGIGRYSSFAQRGGPRAGLLRTTDGGNNWTEITGSGGLIGKNISGVAPRGSTIVLSVNVADSFTCGNIGIFRSTNTGTTFVQSTQATTGFPRGVSYDLATDPLNSNILYSSVTFGSFCDTGVNGVYKSTNTGTSWTKVSNAAMDALIVDGTTNNLEIAARGNDVFVNIVQNGRSAGIFHSSDGGATWSQMDFPGVPQGTANPIASVTPGSPIAITTSGAHGLSSGNLVYITGVTGTTGANGLYAITVTGATTFNLISTNDFNPYGGGGTWQPSVGINPREKPGGQGSIHASILVDQTTPSIAYIGGDRQDSPFPNYIGAMNFTGALFRGNAAIAPPQWEHLTHSDSVPAIPGGGTASSSAPHADSREMVFDANGDIIQVDDGGIYRRTNPTDNTGDWISINGDIRVTEMHDVAYDNLSNMIISGNQDTGTTYQTAAGFSTWNSLHTGDGGDVAVDNIMLAGSNQSVRYTSFQNLAAFRRTVWDTTGSLVSTNFPALTVTGGGAPFVPQFTTPVVVNNVAGGRLLIAGANSLYESTNEGNTITEIGGGLTVTSGGNTMDYGGKLLGVDNPDVFYAISGTSVHVRTTSGGGISSYVVPGASTLTGVIMDPDDWNIAYAIDSNQVFRTTNAGVTWTDITGPIFDVNLRSIAAAPGELFVGGEKGVYTMDMATPGTWTLYGSGLPNVPVWDLDYDDTDKMLVAGTLGRGAWLMPVTPTSAPLVYAAPTVAACGSFAPCLAVTDPVQNAVIAVADGGTVEVLGTHSQPISITNGINGKTVTVQGTTGNLDSTLTFSSDGFSVSSGNLTIRGLNLNGAATVFDQSGGTLTAYANDITGWTTAYNSTGGTASLGNNWWDTASATYNAADPGLPAGDWDKRLGADIGSWNFGTDSSSLGSATLTGGTGTAVVLSYGRLAANAPFGNGIPPYVNELCSDFYDFFVRGSGTWDVTVPVDDNANCNANVRDNDKLYHIPDIANCAPTNGDCWTTAGLTISHGANDLTATGLTTAQLDGTHFVAGDSNGQPPTAILLHSAAATAEQSPLFLMVLVIFSIIAAMMTILVARVLIPRRSSDSDPVQ